MENTNTIYKISSLLTGASSKLATIIHYEQFHKEVNHDPSFVQASVKGVSQKLDVVQGLASDELNQEQRNSIAQDVRKDLEGIKHAYDFLQGSYTEIKDVPIKEKVVGLEYLFE